MSRCRCTKTSKCDRCRKRKSRASDPIRTIYRDHVGNARRRGKEVLWDLQEFRAWCELTHHHENVKNNYEISRFGDVGPYCAADCVSIPKTVNLRLVVRLLLDAPLHGRPPRLFPGARAALPRGSAAGLIPL